MIGYIAAYVATSLAKRIRAMQFHKVQSFSANKISKFSTASLITRATNDVTQVQMAVAIGMQVIVKAPIMAGWAIIKYPARAAVDHRHRRGHRGHAHRDRGADVLRHPRFKKIQWLTDDVNRNMRGT